MRPLYPYEIYVQHIDKACRNDYHRYPDITREEINTLMGQYLSGGGKIIKVAKGKKGPKQTKEGVRFLTSKLFKPAIYRNWDEKK